MVGCVESGKRRVFVFVVCVNVNAATGHASQEELRSIDREYSESQSWKIYGVTETNNY